MRNITFRGRKSAEPIIFAFVRGKAVTYSVVSHIIDSEGIILAVDCVRELRLCRSIQAVGMSWCLVDVHVG